MGIFSPPLGDQLVGDVLRLRGILPDQGLGPAHRIAYAFQHQLTILLMTLPPEMPSV
jgi:hypothetical protein